MTWNQMFLKLTTMLENVSFNEVAKIYNTLAYQLGKPEIDFTYAENSEEVRWIEIN